MLAYHASDSQQINALHVHMMESIDVSVEVPWTTVANMSLRGR